MTTVEVGLLAALALMAVGATKGQPVLALVGVTIQLASLLAR